MTETPAKALDELKPCPFCGSTNVDPEGWMSCEPDGTKKKTGPACDECGGSTDTVERWNSRPVNETSRTITVDIGAAAAALEASPELCAMMNQMVGGPALVEAQSEIDRLRDALESAAEILAQRASGYAARRSSIFNGSILAEELLANALRIRALAALPAQDTADRTGAQISELDEASNACLELAAEHGFATGHGDTVADMIREFSAQIKPPARTTADRTGMVRFDKFSNDEAAHLPEGTALQLSGKTTRELISARTTAARTDGREAIIEQCARIAEGFDGACNSPRMKLFVEAGLVQAVYKRDGEIGAAIRTLSLPDGEKG